MSDLSELDALVRRSDPDRWLSSRFIADRLARADVVALYAFDHELARARLAASNPLLAEIRLTWWREALDELFDSGEVRRHPTAQALAAAVRGRDLPRGPLEAMIDARIEALGATELDEATALHWADAIGGSAMALAALVLDPASLADSTAAAGRAWGLALLRRSTLTLPDALLPMLKAALDAARPAVRELSVAAFPAVAHVTLARLDLKGREASGLGKRLRVLRSVATGQI